MAGHCAATGTGGGLVDSHGWTVKGKFLTVIHLGHAGAVPAADWSSSWSNWDVVFGFLEEEEEGFWDSAGDMKLRASLGMPSFFMASFAPNELNILTIVSEREPCSKRNLVRSSLLN